jgi:uncharacterized protein involved in copper resistance
MRSFLRLTALAAPLLLTAWAFPGCSQDEGAEGKMVGAMPGKTGPMDKGKMDGGAMDKGKMDGGAMDKGKMDGGAMDKGKMDGGAMDKGKMEGTSK